MTRAVALTNMAVVALVLALLAGVYFGTADVTWGARWAALTGAEDALRSLSLILWEWRLPRVLAVATVGGPLAGASSMLFYREKLREALRVAQRAQKSDPLRSAPSWMKVS